MRNFLLGVLTVLIIGGIGFSAYQYGKKTATSEKPLLSETPSPLSPTLSPTIKPTISDSDLIKQALFKKHNWPDDGTITVKVSTDDGKYASGTVTAQGGGGYFYAVKDNGVWIIVADGNGVIMCSSLTKYPNYPTTLIPECYDQTTGKTVKR